ncbi:hypothetical protein DsansV1_C48g0243161 [Dioscorea sansibarensis]
MIGSVFGGTPSFFFPLELFHKEATTDLLEGWPAPSPSFFGSPYGFAASFSPCLRRSMTKSFACLLAPSRISECSTFRYDMKLSNAILVEDKNLSIYVAYVFANETQKSGVD